MTTIVKWVALAGSIALAALAWTPRASAGIMLAGFVVFGGLIVTLVQAWARRQYGWALALIPLAVICNPVMPVPMAPRTVLALNLSCAVTFAACLMFLRREPRMTIASITDPTHRSESL